MYTKLKALFKPGQNQCEILCEMLWYHKSEISPPTQPPT